MFIQDFIFIFGLGHYLPFKLSNQSTCMSLVPLGVCCLLYFTLFNCMGVCALQHRISTGLYNTHNVLVSRGTRNRDIRSKYGVTYYFACAAGLILYLYILCLLMALHVNSLNKNSVQFYTAGVNPTERGEFICMLFNCHN